MTSDLTPREVGTILERLTNLQADVAEIKETLIRHESDVESRLRKLEDFRSRAYALAAIAMGAWMAFGYYLVSHAH